MTHGPTFAAFSPLQRQGERESDETPACSGPWPPSTGTEGPSILRFTCLFPMSEAAPILKIPIKAPDTPAFQTPTASEKAGKSTSGPPASLLCRGRSLRAGLSERLPVCPRLRTLLVPPAPPHTPAPSHRDTALTPPETREHLVTWVLLKRLF